VKTSFARAVSGFDGWDAVTACQSCGVRFVISARQTPHRVEETHSGRLEAVSPRGAAGRRPFFLPDGLWGKAVGSSPPLQKKA
jgi:hypothetical protein